MELSWHNDMALLLSNNIQSHHVFDYILKQCVRADNMIIGSFAMNEAFLRRIIKKRYLIKNIEVFLDLTVAGRSPGNTILIANNVDSLYLINNHSKFIYCRGQKEILAVLSNNATNNNRYEIQVFTSNRIIITDFLNSYNKMKKESIHYEI